MMELVKEYQDTTYKITVSDITEHNGSGNQYVIIEFVDSIDDNKRTALYLGFSKHYIDVSPDLQDKALEDIISSEIEKFITDLGDKIFEGEKYFVYFKSDGVHVNKRFTPF